SFGNDAPSARTSLNSWRTRRNRSGSTQVSASARRWISYDSSVAASLNVSTRGENSLMFIDGFLWGGTVGDRCAATPPKSCGYRWGCNCMPEGAQTATDRAPRRPRGSGVFEQGEDEGGHRRCQGQHGDGGHARAPELGPLFLVLRARGKILQQVEGG